MRVLLSLATALGGVCVVHGSHPVADPTYVVQIHANRDGFVPPADAHEQLRTQSMTTESGQRFECFLPLTPLQKQQRALEQAAANPSAGVETRELEVDDAAKELDNFLTFARAAVKKVRPMCVQFIDVVDQWVYEICPGVLIRKVGLEQRVREAPKKRRMDTVSGDGREAVGRLQQGRPPQETVTETKPERVETEAKTKPEPVEMDAETKPKPEAAHEVQDLAAFASDDETKLPYSYEEFPNGEMQKRVTTYSKPLYTQVFRARGKSHGQVGDIHVQFLCSASARDDYVGAVAWRTNGGGNDETLINKEPAAFVIASRLFCNPKHSDSNERFSVSSLLQPLAELQTCIKRNEGWWTYEFCFGHGIRQYHRENDGKVTAEFSLGSYDFQQNQLLDSTGASLVTEHIDAAAHDTARPAFIEMYTGGTHCKEFDVSTPRKSRVFFYCSQGSANHHIVSIKETQTCTYTIKIASPVVCDHPHFITEERKTEDKVEVVHCIPVVAGDGDGDGQVSDTTTVTMPPAAAHRDQERSDVREVQVDAT